MYMMNEAYDLLGNWYYSVGVVFRPWYRSCCVFFGVAGWKIYSLCAMKLDSVVLCTLPNEWLQHVLFQELPSMASANTYNEHDVVLGSGS